MTCSDPATRLRSPISVHAWFLVWRPTTPASFTRHIFAKMIGGLRFYSPATDSFAMGLVLVPGFGLPQIQKDHRWSDSGVCIGGLSESVGGHIFQSVAGTGHQTINSRKPGRRIYPETIFREDRDALHPGARAETSFYLCLGCGEGGKMMEGE